MSDLKKRYKESIIISIVIYVILLFYLGTMTQAPINNVIIGTSPILLQIAFIALFFNHDLRTEIFWVSPIILTLLFLGAWNIGLNNTLNQLEAPQLSLLNLIISYIITGIVFFIASVKQKKIKKKELVTKTKYRNLLVEYRRMVAANERIVLELKKELETLRVNSKQEYTSIINEYYAHYEKQKKGIEQLKSELANSSNVDMDEYEKLLHKFQSAKLSDKRKIAELKTKIRTVQHKEKKNTLQIKQEHQLDKQRSSEEISRLNEELRKIKEELNITKGNFSKTLRSIEDKCKAINFVIGRVYSDKKGGSPELRKKLIIDREWYNQFSKLTKNFKDDDAPALLEILYLIRERLSLHKKREKDVLGNIKAEKIPVKRNKEGNDPILLILANNDEDPVLYYHEEAKEIATKLIKYLHETYFSHRI